MVVRNASPDDNRIDFRVLGPLEVAAAGGPVDVGGPRLRGALALLVAGAGRVVSVAEFVDGLWGDNCPPDAERTVRTYMSRLRKALLPAAAELIVTRSPGYLLLTEPDTIDAVRFEQLAQAGGRALQAATPAVANERLLAALRLWQGTAYGEFKTIPTLDAERMRLERLRRNAIEDRIDTDLAAGLGSELVAELVELTTAHPGHERLWGQLMTVLYRAGRQADALAAFRRARRVLAESSGLTPTPALTEIHRQVLAQDSRLLAPRRTVAGPEPATTRPAQLPPAVPAFTGRRDEIARLDELLPGAARPAAVVISAVSGTAGVGKTALAVHWAARVRSAFPDGQLYLNLRGFDPDGSTVHPTDAVKSFLAALGVPPADIPPGLAAQTGLYRSLLTGRRLLVVLDNARDADQVRPLLPNAPGCLALVTSRNRLTSLAAAEGAHLVNVDLLTAAEARDLLSRRLGGHRVTAEPAAVEEIAARCAGLPLALAIVAARAAAQPHLPLAGLAAELRESGSRLDALDGGDPASQVRAVFSWSYRALSKPAARLFRLLGLHPGPDIAVPAAAALTDTQPHQARALLAELTRGHLLTEHAPGRYGCHDLLRSYATELAGGRQSGALHRLFDHYLHTARTADALLTPQPNPIVLPEAQPGAAPEQLADHQEALAWFTAERPVLLGAVEHARITGFDRHAWQLAATLTTFLDRQAHWPALARAQTTALAAARRQDDRVGQASAHRNLGLAQDRLGHPDLARDHYLRALDLFGALGSQAGQARTRQHLARMSAAQGRYQQASYHARHSLRHYRNADDRAGESAALNHLGWFHAQLGDQRAALAHCRQALALAQEIGDLNGQAHTWDSLGYVHHQLAQPEQAVDCYQHAVDLFQHTGERRSAATALVSLADAHQAAGAAAAARSALRDALAVLDQLGLPDTDPLLAAIKRSLARSAT
jgi:DNA-binding SARP family transcriptional activator/tetratricopeptide (TPR) repeat protein